MSEYTRGVTADYLLALKKNMAIADPITIITGFEVGRDFAHIENTLLAPPFTNKELEQFDRIRELVVARLKRMKGVSNGNTINFGCNHRFL